MIICVTEDRLSFEPAVKLLLMSLNKYSPTVPVYLVFPPASPRFISWLAKYKQVSLRTQGLATGSTFNIKPQVMLSLMDKGHDEVLWIDSDIIVCRDLASALGPISRDTVVVTEESLWGRHEDRGAWRARGWGFDVGRVLPFALNACIIRATREHQPLLTRWQQLIDSPAYRSAQQLDWSSRPPHMHGDSEVWSALLCSKEFSDLPLKILRRGKDVIQYFGPYGYTTCERVCNLLAQSPAFIHSLGPSKPWIAQKSSSSSTSFKQYLEAVYLDTSPYTLTAMQYRGGLDGDLDWMEARYLLGKVLRTAGFSQGTLAGLPIAIAADINRLGKAFVTVAE
jgi:hypothetical protein